MNRVKLYTISASHLVYFSYFGGEKINTSIKNSYFNFKLKSSARKKCVITNKLEYDARYLFEFFNISASKILF